MPSWAQRLTVFGDTWRSSATCAVRRYLGSVVWGNALSRSYCRPPGLGRPYACRGRMPSSVLHRLAILRCILVRLGSRPVACMDVDQSAVAGPWSFARHPPQWLPLKQLACTAIVLPLGMPGRPVVTRSGVAASVRPAEVHVLPRTCRSSLSPCRRRQRRAGVGRYLQDGWREGQQHDGWNREVVQRREGLWLHRP
jgi:hypothetical protein